MYHFQFRGSVPITVVMFGPILSRAVLAIGFVVVTAIVCGGVWSFGYGAAVDQLEKRGRADLALAASR